jgi:hypothetical protein
MTNSGSDCGGLGRGKRGENSPDPGQEKLGVERWTGENEKPSGDESDVLSSSTLYYDHEENIDGTQVGRLV